MASNDNMIAALLREREGYERRGLKDRVGQVDEQLKHYGHDAKAGKASGPKGRTAPPQQTADGGKGPAKKTAAKKTAAAAPPAPAAEPAEPAAPAAPPAE